MKTMTINQFRSFARRRLGIEFNAAESHGGGNRDHRNWTVSFIRRPVSDGGVVYKHYGIEHFSEQVQCRTYSGKFDGKRACRTEAIGLAWRWIACQHGVEIEL